jgi:hypothetical protein
LGTLLHFYEQTLILGGLRFLGRLFFLLLILLVLGFFLSIGALIAIVLPKIKHLVKTSQIRIGE